MTHNIVTMWYHLKVQWHTILSPCGIILKYNDTNIVTMWYHLKVQWHTILSPCGIILNYNVTQYCHHVVAWLCLASLLASQPHLFNETCIFVKLMQIFVFTTELNSVMHCLALLPLFFLFLEWRLLFELVIHNLFCCLEV